MLTHSLLVSAGAAPYAMASASRHMSRLARSNATKEAGSGGEPRQHSVSGVTRRVTVMEAEGADQEAAELQDLLSDLGAASDSDGELDDPRQLLQGVESG